MNIRREYELKTGYSIDYELQGVGNLKYVQYLEKENLALRKSQLSAVPSEEEFNDKVDKLGKHKDMFGNSYLPPDIYRGFRMCYEWILWRKEKTERGIAG